MEIYIYIFNYIYLYIYKYNYDQSNRTIHRNGLLRSHYLLGFPDLFLSSGFSEVLFASAGLLGS